MIDATKQLSNNEIILYQSPDFAIDLQVRIENETVWLTQAQIGVLFGVKVPAISKHLRNIYDSNELDEFSTFSILENVGNVGKQTYQTKYYNLDAILSIGYRVNSKNATQFRIWANKVLKNYILKGYCIQPRFEAIEKRQWTTEQKVEQLIEIVHKQLPCTQGIFFEGQIFDAYELVTKIIKSAKLSIILIDNYIDETTLRLLSKREENVKSTIYTPKNSPQLKLDIEKYDAQFDKISIINFTKSHDRFLIIDKRDLYHIGASLKDVGKKWFAFSKLHLDIKQLLENIEKIMDTNSEN